MNWARIAGTIAVAGPLALVALRGQVNLNPRPKAEVAEAKLPPHNLRVDTNLVLIPVSVCDATNHPVTGLEKEHFRVFDDKVEQTVTHFAMDDESVAVGIILDISGSMGPKMRKARQAGAAFFQTANPEDEFFLVEFNDQPKLMVPLTFNIEEIQNQLTFTQSKGRTALLDAIMLGLHEIKNSKRPAKRSCSSPTAATIPADIPRPKCAIESAKAMC